MVVPVIMVQGLSLFDIPVCLGNSFHQNRMLATSSVMMRPGNPLKGSAYATDPFFDSTDTLFDLGAILIRGHTIWCYAWAFNIRFEGFKLHIHVVNFNFEIPFVVRLLEMLIKTIGECVILCILDHFQG